MKNNSSVDDTDSQALLNQIVIEYMREKKRKRFWQWVRRMFFLLVILWLVYEFISMRSEDAVTRSKPHVGLIDVKGAIFDDKAADSDNFIKGLNKAYDSKALKAVIIRIDSPGGSPVQADYMYKSLRYYRQKYPEIKVYAVCVDVCASAAYYVAAAADEI